MPDPSPLPGTPIVVGGIQLFSRVDPFSGGIDERNRPYRDVCYLCAGEDVADACDALKGIGDYAAQPWGFPRPHRYPNNENLVCQAASFKLKGPRSKGKFLVTAPYGEIMASYGVPEFDVFGDDSAQSFGGEAIPWASYQVRGGEEVVAWPKVDKSNTPTTLYVFNPGGAGDPDITSITPDVKTFSRRIATKDYILKRAMIPNFVEFDDILTTLQGTVNESPIWGRGRGTLLLRPNDYDPGNDPGGRRTGEFTMVFSWREVEWNAFPIPGRLDEFAVVTDNTADENTFYEYADWTTLLRYGL